MSHFLNASQLAEECNALGLIKEERALIVAAQKAAEAIAAKRGDVAIVSDSDNQPGFAGLCVGFGPVKDGDKCPDDFAFYDPGSEWAEDGGDS